MSQSWIRYVLMGVVLACGVSWTSAAEPDQTVSADQETREGRYGPRPLATVGSVQPTVCPVVTTQCPASRTAARRP